MRPLAWAKRFLALAVTVVFVLGILVTPALAAKGSRSFSTPKSSGGFKSGGTRSFSTPKAPTPTTPSRSFTTPKTTTPTAPSRSFSTPPPPTTTSPGQGYSSTPQSYSSGSRNYSEPSRSFSSPRPSTTAPPAAPLSPPPTYDTGKTKYPTRPPVVVYGPSPYEPWYWHDYYYGQPFWWRLFHRPVYYGDSGWGISWVSVLAAGVGIWILLGIISAQNARRRRR